jgi:ParB-like chromosome segregation protein Spo0J
MKKESLKISYKSTSSLIPYANNSRTHTDEQIDQVVKSIAEFGFTNPILIDEHGGIIAGHCRVLASMRSGLESVPTITLAGLTEQQKKAYVIADNKLALNAEWNNELLRLEIEQIASLDYDIDLLGFSSDELSKLFIELDDVSIDDDAASEDLSEIVIKFDSIDAVEVINAVTDAVSRVKSATVWCADEQV